MFKFKIYDEEGFCDLYPGYVPKGKLIPMIFRDVVIREDKEFLVQF